MCKFRFRFLVALLTFGVGVLVIGVWRSSPASENVDEISYSQSMVYPNIQQQQVEEHDSFKPDKTTSLNCNDQQNKINYQGISFVCNSQFDSKIDLLEFSKSPLQFEDDKPDYVHPSYISFKFRNKEEKSEKDSIYINQISIYPIKEYGRMYSVNEFYKERIDEDIKSFKMLLSAKQAHKHTYAGFLAATDGSFALKSHLKYISFKNGQGVGFVTQITMEPSIINNEDLIWVFEGVTNDNKYYLKAEFSVNTSVLPATSADKFEGYSTENYAKLSKQYDKYIALVKKRLDASSANNFQPNLDNLENIISSLEVK